MKHEAPTDKALYAAVLRHCAHKPAVTLPRLDGERWGEVVSLFLEGRIIGKIQIWPRLRFFGTVTSEQRAAARQWFNRFAAARRAANVPGHLVGIELEWYCLQHSADVVFLLYRLARLDARGGGLFVHRPGTGAPRRKRRRSKAA